LAGVVFVPQYLKTGSIMPGLYHGVFFLSWIFFSIMLGKFRFGFQRIRNELTAIIFTGITVWGLVSLYVISMEKYNKDYHSLFKQILLVVFIEILARLGFYFINRKKYQQGKTTYFAHMGLKDQQWSLMFMNLIIVFISFMFLVWLKPATLRIYIPNFYPFLIGLLVWNFILNLVTRKHCIRGKVYMRDFLIPIFRANALTVLLLAIVVYLFQFFEYSRLIIFGTVVLSAALECVLAIYINLHMKVTRNIDESESVFGITPSDEKLPRKSDHPLMPLTDLNDQEDSAEAMLRQQVLINDRYVVDFIDQHINMKGISKRAITVLDTQTPFNIEAIQAPSRQLLINLHKVNDIKRINEYFALLNEKTQLGGYIVGCGITIRSVYERYCSRFPKPLGHILYFFHFFFRRVLPKLPITREINYFITKGENRTLSKTEILGRLVYSGFKILDCREINGMNYFIAGKVNVPYKGDSPSYGPLISLKRVGKDGKIIDIYKFRTMHPYSEYLQDFVYEQNKLAKGGKLKNDFRIAGWGRVLRKMWIDEFPQFINFLRGDIKLVGVRAISRHYFSLYPKEFQEYRKQVKPGILPPFYVDMPETMEEIVASEKKYIDAYMKYGILTDIKYGAIIMYNIIFRGKRSA
jgi:lipopolysaccharide/colanic/teichoic acid biosynthesis glycosyltransferase